jgi:hypothetical protein
LVRIANKFLLILIALVLISPFINAQPTIWHNSPKTGNDIGDIFSLKFEILSSETANYTISLDLGDKFAMLSGNATQTIHIPKNETRTFIFDIKLIKSLEDGKYPIYYDAYIKDAKFKSDKVYIRIGEQAPGFETIAIIIALAIGTIVWKNRKH